MPERTCRICRAKRPKGELVRWSLQGGQLVQAASGGRGIYSCPGECTERIEHNKVRFKK